MENTKFNSVMGTRTLILIYEHSAENNRIYLELLRGKIGWETFFDEIKRNALYYMDKINTALVDGYITEDVHDKARSEINTNYNFYRRKWMKING